MFVPVGGEGDVDIRTSRGERDVNVRTGRGRACRGCSYQCHKKYPRICHRYLQTLWPGRSFVFGLVMC